MELRRDLWDQLSTLDKLSTTTSYTMCIVGYLEGFSDVDPAKKRKTSKKNYEVKIDFLGGGGFVIFVDPTDTAARD